MCGRADGVFYYNQPLSSKEDLVAFFFFKCLLYIKLRFIKYFHLYKNTLR